MTALRVKDLSFAYGDLEVLEGLSFEARPGELISFVGPSGCGKSTLLRCLCGLLDASAGSVALNGSLDRRESQCSFVFQKPVLLPWLTVTENLALPFRLQGLLVPHADINHQLQRLGLENFEEHFPGQLSVGMAQRVAFARALSEHRKILLLDEPYSGLDELTKRTLATYLSRTFHEDRLTAILVTHSIHDAVFLGNRIIVLSDRPARILESIEIPLGQPREADLWLGRELAPYIDQARLALERRQT